MWLGVGIGRGTIRLERDTGGGMPGNGRDRVGQLWGLRGGCAGQSERMGSGTGGDGVAPAYGRYRPIVSIIWETERGGITRSTWPLLSTTVTWSCLLLGSIWKTA